MCGDMDEEEGRLEDELYARFLVNARSLLAELERGGKRATGEALVAYMDKLFADGLSRSVRDGEAAAEERCQRLRAQPLVFARLAGFLAGHLSLEEDPLRKVMEALMHGYGEAETIAPEHGHDHDHGHDHGHDHKH